jgi:hypothetical protein
MPYLLLEGPDGRPVSAQGTADGKVVIDGGGGGGDASAANQELALTALDSIYDALQLVGLEATSVQIRDAIVGLGDGATLADLAAAFATDAITQTDILAALEVQGIDIATVSSNVALMVPDLDAVRVALENRLPAALVGGRLDANIGAFLGATGAVLAAGGAKPTTAQIYSWVVANNPTAWGGANTAGFPSGNEYGLAVQGYVANGSSIGSTERPVLIGGSDGTNKRTLTMKAGNPIAADYGAVTRQTPLQKSSVKTAAGTPAAALVVRAGPCWLYDVFVSNQSTTNAGYLTVYDLTSAPTHGAAATARKVVGRHLDTKVSGDPFNYKEDFDGLYFSTGCVLVIENAEDDANTNTSGAQTMTMNATFVAGT